MRDVTAQFHRGRVCAIFGENGAGKSTLLRVVAGLTQPSGGTVWPHDQRVGYMAHASMLYDELSGMENMRYFGSLYSLRDDRRFEDLMQRVSLDPKLQRRIADYSQGMRQRLSLARAIIHDPEIVLLDEPFSNLDAHSSRDIAGLLLQMRNAGKCVVVVTHQASLLQGVADESLLITRGQLVTRAPGIAAVQSAANSGEPSA